MQENQNQQGNYTNTQGVGVAVQEKPTIVKTDVGAVNGQNKCPKCGATDISLNINNGHLRSNYCRYEFVPEQVSGIQTDIQNLQGEVLTSGIQNIQADASDVVTLKCTSCGAEVVIDTNEAMHARCHWCRNTLSINQQIPNGSVPDLVLPFHITKAEAEQQIRNFVKKRQFYANPKFKKEFTTENIMGVYFPYMVVDVNGHALLSGQGEHLVRRYKSGSNEHAVTYYDADVYQVEREFDVVIQGLTIESNKDKLNRHNDNKTNNVINAIMPFDIENCVKYNANYLKGFSSEKRDVNVDELRPLVETQSKDIARFAVNDTLKNYDRGVAWQKQDLNMKGQQWKAAYLPVWLYSYQQVQGNKKVLHYVAVNARTKETMGSVPIHLPKLLFVSFLIELLSIILLLFIGDDDAGALLLLSGFAYYAIMYAKYRNQNARHFHELETKKQIGNLRQVDNYVTRRTGLRNSRIEGCNNEVVADSLLSNVSDIADVVDSISEITNDIK